MTWPSGDAKRGTLQGLPALQCKCKGKPRWLCLGSGWALLVALCACSSETPPIDSEGAIQSGMSSDAEGTVTQSAGTSGSASSNRCASSSGCEDDRNSAISGAGSSPSAEQSTGASATPSTPLQPSAPPVDTSSRDGSGTGSSEPGNDASSTLPPNPTEEWSWLTPRDESGLVHVDGSYLVLRILNNSGVFGPPARIEVLELETGVTHPVSATSPDNSEAIVTPRRDVVFFDDILAHDTAVQRVIYLTERGYVPPQVIPGYTEETIGGWGFSAWEWSVDGRFAATWREHSEQAYVDLMDAHSGQLLGSVLVAESGAMFSFQGYTFEYGSDEPEGFRSGVLAATSSGVWDFWYPSGGGTVSADGTLYYTELDANEVKQWVRHAPGGAPAALSLPPQFVDGGFGGASADGQRLIMTEAYEQGSGLFAVRTDGGEPEPILELHGSLRSPEFATEVGDHLLIALFENARDTLVAIRPTDLHAEVLVSDVELSLDFGVNGNHFFYRPVGEAITFVGFDEQGAVPFAVPGTEGAEYLGCARFPTNFPPTDRTSVIVDGKQLKLIDLARPEASVAATIDVTDPAATIDCPIWSLDGKSLVYSERRDEETRIFRIVWRDEGPLSPELVLSSVERVIPEALR